MKSQPKKVANKPISLPKAVPLEIKTRHHEPALLVVLAYVIGFTTAFIAFKLAGDRSWLYSADQSAQSGESVGERPALLIKESGLFIGMNGQERVLSAKLSDGDFIDGFHSDIASARVSPDGKFVHYCVVTDDPDNCVNFVYSVARDMSYRVKNGDERFVSKIEDTDSFGWDSFGRLVLGDYQSASADEPWRIVER